MSQNNMKLTALILLIPKQWFQVEEGDSDISKLPFSSFPLLEVKSWHGHLFLGLKTPFSGMVSEISFSDLWQNSDVETEKSMCHRSLKFFLMSQEYHRVISLDEC